MASALLVVVLEALSFAENVEHSVAQEADGQKLVMHAWTLELRWALVVAD